MEKGLELAAASGTADNPSGCPCIGRGVPGGDRTILTRDDVLVLFDGSMDNVLLQHPTATLTQLYEDESNVIQGDKSLFVDMPDMGIQFIVNYALMLIITRGGYRQHPGLSHL